MTRQAPAFILRHRSLDRAQDYPAYAAIATTLPFSAVAVAAIFNLPMTLNTALLAFEISAIGLVSMLALWVVTNLAIWLIR